MARRLAFRFALICAALLIFPFPLWLVAPRLAALWFEPWAGSVRWFAEHVLGIERPPLLHTGSGDTLFHYVELLWIAILAALGTLAWTAFARRRPHLRLAAAATVVVRYYLATTILGYGLAKVVPMQFPPPWLGRYDQSIGEMSPMGLLWTFMGHSQAYTLFAGLAECAAAILLLWRRTYVIGALVTAVVMTNVVALNFCYDVPVKLLSIRLLVMALALAMPHARRLVTSLLGRPTPEVKPRARGSLAGERLRVAAKLVLLTAIALRCAIYFTLPLERPRSVLHGIWSVERFVVDGVDRPPLFTDDTRWRKLIIAEGPTVWIRMATDRREGFRAEIEASTITILDGVQRVEWHYTRRDDHLVIVGTFHDHAIEAELVLDPPPLLESRGFHWIQEQPFNR